MAANDPTRKIITVPFRMSFPNIPPHGPREDETTKRKTFQLSMLFPPGTSMEPYETALRAAMVEKFGDDPKKWPRCKCTPATVIKDFDEYNANSKTPLPNDWSGWKLIRANAAEKSPPLVVGDRRGPDGKFPRVTDPREVYSGRWASAAIDAYYFPGDKNNGVTFGLKAVQLLKHDTCFAGAVFIPEDDFQDASDEWSGRGDAFERGSTSAAAAAANGSDWG
jgi:hypothetical protein